MIGTLTAQPSASVATELDCYLYTGSSPGASFYAKLTTTSIEVLTGLQTVDVSATTTISMRCHTVSDTVLIPEPRLQALKVSTIHTS